MNPQSTAAHDMARYAHTFRQPLGPFGTHADPLTDGGYDVVPVTCPWHRFDWINEPGRQPAMRGWLEGCPRSKWHLYAGCSLGVLTRNTPAVDIDVMDEGLAESIHFLADQKLGEAPFRIGRYPKRLLPYRLAGEPFLKLSLSWTLDGEQGAIEILANGQKFVALGIHHSTGQPYVWHRDPELSIPHAMLPPLDQDRAVRFLKSVAFALEGIGATEIKLHGAPEPPPSPRPFKPTLVDVDQVARVREALDRIGCCDDYGDWVRVGLALKSELPGADGAALWHWWSRLSTKYVEKEAERKWRSFKPRSIGAGTLFYLAENAR
jgi:putative DNA primase/helicase